MLVQQIKSPGVNISKMLEVNIINYWVLNTVHRLIWKLLLQLQHYWCIQTLTQKTFVWKNGIIWAYSGQLEEYIIAIIIIVRIKFVYFYISLINFNLMLIINILGGRQETKRLSQPRGLNIDHGDASILLTLWD